MSRLIVKDLPKNITEQELRKKFSEKGTVTECSLRYTPEGEFRKFAFVGFKETSEANEAIRYFNNSYVNATKIKVSMASDFKNSKSNVTWSKHSKQKGQEKVPVNNNSEEQFTSDWAIKVTGLPPNVKKNQIDEFFKPLKVLVSIPPNKKVNTKLVVGFESEKERDEAMRRNKNYIGSNKIFLHKHTGQVVSAPQVVQTKNTNDRNEDKDQEKAIIMETGRLFVRNLPYCSTEDDLVKLFSQYGHATVELQVDKFRNEQKGFAFVNFVMPENALAAYECLDGTVFQGRMLHVVGGKAKKEDTEDLESMPFSKKKEILKKKSAANVQRWNTLFIGQDALAEVIAKEEGIEKKDLLLSDGKESIAAKLALKQTKIVNEIRQFLIDNGVSLESFGNTSSPRSKTILLAKNLPAGTTEKELREIFREYSNSLVKIIIPAYGLTAIIQFNNEILASQAFKDLAYSKIKHLPLYLEWAPVDVLSGQDKDEPVEEEEKAKEDGENEEEEEEEEEEDDDEDEEVEDSHDVDLSQSRRFVYVKNIPNDATEESIKELFQIHGKVVSVKLTNYKTDTSSDVTATYGFVEYGLPEFAEKCIREMSSKEVNGHKFDMKISDRPGVASAKSDKPEKKGKKGEKSDRDTTKKMIIKNIPFEASLKDLKQLFSNYPGVQTIRLPKKAGADAGSHKGFAFVEFNTRFSAKGAYDELCHNTTLFGRRLVLEWSRSSDNCVSVADVAHLRKRTAENYGKSGTSKKRRVDLLNDLQGGEKQL